MATKVVKAGVDSPFVDVVAYGHQMAGIVIEKILLHLGQLACKCNEFVDGLQLPLRQVRLCVASGRPGHRVLRNLTQGWHANVCVSWIGKYRCECLQIVPRLATLLP